MGRKAVWRVWYGKRLGIPNCFEDIDNFEGAANFAAFVEADRIEVVRGASAASSAEQSA